MNRVLAPTMVGNDFYIRKVNRPSIRRELRVEDQRVYRNKIESNIPVTPPVASSPMAATVVAPASLLQPLSQPVFNPTFEKPKILTKKRTLSFVVCMVLIFTTILAVAEKNAVLAFAHKVESTGNLIIYGWNQELHKTKASMSTQSATQPVYDSVTVPVVDENDAISNIISQKVTLNVGPNTIQLSSGDIMNWLSLKQNGNQATISVNTAQVSNYFQQFVKTYSRAPVNQIQYMRYGEPVVKVIGHDGIQVQYDPRVVAQVKNQLLRNGGLSITLPAQVIPFQTVTN